MGELYKLDFPNGLGNSHGVGNKNASGKRSPEAIANIKAGIAAARRIK